LRSDSNIPGWSRILVNKHHSNHLYFHLDLGCASTILFQQTSLNALYCFIFALSEFFACHSPNSGLPRQPLSAVERQQHD
jgi:hypothetical protein